MREGVLQPHARNDRERFLPHRPGLFRVDAKSSHFNEGGRAPSAEFDPAIAENVEDRSPFRDANGMIVLRGQERHRVADADGSGSLRNCAVEHLRRWTVGELRQKVMLDRPKILKAHLLGQHHLGNHLFIGILDDARVMRFGDLNLVH